MVRSPDGDTPFFEITTGVLQGDTLSPFLFIICLDYVLKTSLDNYRKLDIPRSNYRHRLRRRHCRNKYSQLPISRTRKEPGKVSDLARCPTYPIFRISCKYDMRCAV